MTDRTKGKCKYCGKEYTRAYMLKHLSDCKARSVQIGNETEDRRCGWYELVIYGKNNKDYWLIIEIREDAKLKDLDAFLRDIWLECCGHLSAFQIDGVSYESMPEKDSFWGRDPKGMYYKLSSVLKKGMAIDYEYDFGATTDLVIEVHDYRQGVWKLEKLTVLSRNDPPEFLCDVCHENPASVICPECIYDGAGFLCDACSATHECGAGILLPVCNSPRMGVCGYEGSIKYPDRFEPDEPEPEKFEFNKPEPGRQ